MTRDQAVAALTAGLEIARDLVAAGNRCLLTGDMGIANTTASAALICAFTGADPAEATGRGTGIDAATYARKIDVVCRGLARHRPDPADPVGVLAAFGGFEHAALAGFILGAAALRVPVILDGVIAGAAALAAPPWPPTRSPPASPVTAVPSPGMRLRLATWGCARWSTWGCGSARAPAPCWPCRWCRARRAPCATSPPSTPRAWPTSPSSTMRHPSSPKRHHRSLANRVVVTTT